MITDEHVLSFALGAAMIVYALMFKYGVFRGVENSTYKKIVNLEELLWGNLPENFGKGVDSISFWIALAMGIAIVANAILNLLFPTIPIVSMIFLLVALPGIMVARILMAYRYKSRIK